MRSLDEEERKGYRAVAKVITKWGDAWKFILMGLAPYILDVPTKGPKIFDDHWYDLPYLYIGASA